MLQMKCFTNWTADISADRISTYKSKPTFIVTGFEADKPRMYSELRVMMAQLNADINVEFFVEF